MRRLLLLTVLSISGLSWTSAQTVCTVTGTSPLNWPTNGSGIVCAEGGNAFGKDIVRIPAGFTVNFDHAADTWTGTQIEVFGTMNVPTNPGNTINASIIVKTGGVLNIGSKLNLGSATGCGFYVAVGSGGLVDVGSTGADYLSICGVGMFKGNGACNTCGGTNSARCAIDPSKPYCEPATGFTGQTAYDQFGYNIALPIALLYFNAETESEIVKLHWGTSMEENFYKFIVERSNDGLAFEAIGEKPGNGFDLYDIVSKYAFEDKAPLLGYNYYRLKAVDLDDTFEYFDVRAVKVAGTKTIAIYANPSNGEVISFRTNFSASESDRIILVNQLGIEIFNAPVSANQSTIRFQNKLGSGIYILRYVSNNFEQTARVVVKN